MYVDDLIKELEQWNAPNSEVTIDGFDIERVTCADRGNNLVLVSNSFVEDEEREDFEDKISDLEYDLRRAEEDIENYEEWVEDFKEAAEMCEEIFGEFKEYLDKSDIDTRKLQTVLDKLDYVQKDYHYEF